MTFFRQLAHFTYQQAMSSIFPVIIFFALGVSKFIEIPFLPRYDLILIICIVAQYVMIRSGLETLDELKVITLFHLLGLALEIYKVHMGSWAYPDQAYSKVFGVPLYSGFMYASVASYIVQAWRRMDLKMVNWPKTRMVSIVGLAIYLNFFTHHYMYDVRWILTGLLALVFIKTHVFFTVNKERYQMPLFVSFLLIGFFIWIAENISTLLDGYRYPNQGQAWEIVHIGKISSWFLLVVVSIILVAQLRHAKERQQPFSEVKDNTEFGGP